MTLALEDLTPDRLHNYLWHLTSGWLDPSEEWVRDRRARDWELGLTKLGPNGPSPDDIVRGEWTLDTQFPDPTGMRSPCVRSQWGRESLANRQPVCASRGAPMTREEVTESIRQEDREARERGEYILRLGDPYSAPRQDTRPHIWHCVSADERITCCRNMRPVGEPADLLHVPHDERCASSSGWPPSLLPRTSTDSKTRRLDQVRHVLVEEFGPYCAICKDLWATKVDHSHVSGLVRGYLCQTCNRTLDHCPHPEGDPRADYLNNPPALSLGLPYPGHTSMLRQARYRPRVEKYTRMTEALGLPSLVGAYTPVEEKGAPVPEPTTDAQPPPETASESRDPVVRGVETKDAKRVTLYLHPDDYEFIRYDIAGGDLQSVLRSLIACAREDEALQDQVAQLSRTAPRGGG